MKKRLDLVLVEQGYFQSRQKAQAAIMAGLIVVNGEREDKAGTQVSEDAHIHIKGEKLPYVSRGGLKLKKGIDTFEILLEEATCLDIGASTGGFTDCMLQHGAKKVYSIDVGRGQLDWSLRNHKKVVCMERTNMRHLKPEDIGEEADFISIDVSFISLKLIIPPALACLKKGGEVIALIKPQFEAGKENVGKKGVVRDSKVHRQVVEDILHFIKEQGCQIRGLTFSPIKGPQGNIEYLVYFAKVEDDDWTYDIEAVIESSHTNLDENGDK